MSNGETNTVKENQAETENNANKENGQECGCEDVKNLENEVSDQEGEIIRLTKEIDTLKDLLQRRQADFENFRKRTVKLQEDYKKLAIKDFACDIINVNDDIIRAIEVSENLSGQESPETKDSFIEGVKLVSKRIEEILNKYGIEEIEAESKPFNPNYHEALEIENSDAYGEDTVTKVYQKGFKLDEYVVRSAKVRVSKPVPKKSEGPDENEKCS
ncbi:MAG TPA: nucleotide exchange factor GrpE [Spirochaetota bacterium]|nr:nucleotide exchange factor GrpE [Spirochaetota bacterium]HPS85996.1 nucleotide exchange factor GrpE [Spirochaetota bacterium]